MSGEMRRPGERLVLSGRTAGGSGGGAGNLEWALGQMHSNGLVLRPTHLSRTFAGLTALPSGAGGAAVPLLVQWCHAGLPVAVQQSAPLLPALASSPGKSSLCQLPAH